MLLYCPIPDAHREELGEFIDLDCDGNWLILPDGKTYGLVWSVFEWPPHVSPRIAIKVQGKAWEIRALRNLQSTWSREIVLMLPRKLPRRAVVEELRKRGVDFPILYLGMQNLDELRTHTPWALCTRVPFAAALMGIALDRRERRPKNLNLNYDLLATYPPSVVELAKHNLKVVKEAGGQR